MSSKVEEVRNKFKAIRDVLVCLAAGFVVAVSFLAITGKLDNIEKWEDHNDGRFMIKHTDKSGKVTYSEAKGYNLVVDTATGVNYICYDEGGCSPLYSPYGKVYVKVGDIDWNRRD